jgi:CRISPR-associated protein Cas1
MLPRDTVSAKLKVQQYIKAINPKAKRYIASAIVDAKIGKSLELLLKLADYYSVLDKAEIEKSFKNMEARFKGTSDVLTLEGNISILYWAQMQRVYASVAPQFNFTNRNGRHRSWNTLASDPINAMLNYAYAIVESEVRKSLNSIGFDLSIGYLHELLNGRDSLVYDVQELYRWLADLSVLQLLEEGVKPSEFLVTENYHIRLKGAAKRLVEKIKINFNTRTRYKGANCTNQNILYDQIRGLANYLMDKQAVLEFDLPEIQVKRNDESELRDRILNMSPAEYKKLGLRRNTLHYMKKNIRDGKKIKIYDKIMDKLSD